MALGIIGIIILIVAVLIILYILLKYNSLVTLRIRISNAWAQIDVQLKRRFDLIPNLVETVKGYAKHEKETFKMVTEARNLMANATSLKDKAKADNMISGALKTLFAVAENYPQLKANENFMMLQEELSGTESKIAYSRQFYNDNVMRFNIVIQKFPGNIIASIFNFQKNEFFKTEGEEREAVQVKF